MEDIIKQFITGENSIILRFNNLKIDFELKKINEYSYIKLTEEFKKFRSIYEELSVINFKLFKLLIEHTNQNKKDYFDLSSIYISRIQNIYLESINNRINQLSTEKNLRKAKYSICLGFGSIILGIASIVLGLVISFNADKKYNTFSRELKESISIINSSNKNDFTKLLNNDSMIVKTLDSNKVQIVKLLKKK